MSWTWILPVHTNQSIGYGSLINIHNTTIIYIAHFLSILKASKTFVFFWRTMVYICLYLLPSRLYQFIYLLSTYYLFIIGHAPCATAVSPTGPSPDTLTPTMISDRRQTQIQSLMVPLYRKGQAPQGDHFIPQSYGIGELK